MDDQLSRAERAVEDARVNLDTVLDSVAPRAEELLHAEIEAIIEATVARQYRVTERMDPAELVTFKFNVMQSATAAVSGVRGAIRNVDLESRSRKASPNATGESFIRLPDVLSPLLSGVIALLKEAGYNMGIARESTGLDGAGGLSVIAGGGQFMVLSRQIDAAVERLGKAKLVLAAAEDTDGARRARDAWNNAGPSQ